jgi:hypothetical protein
MSPPLPLLWRLPEGLMRRECIRRQQTGKHSKRRNMPIRQQQHKKRWKYGRKWRHRKRNQSRRSI